MKKYFLTSVFFPIFLTIFISIFFSPLLAQNNNFNIILATTNYLWPTPGYNKITSDFGYRKSPTKGASSYHGGIDIASPENSPVYAIDDGTIIYTGFLGANRIYNCYFSY